MENSIQWLNNPDNEKLFDFFVERTKNVTEVMNHKRLVKEFIKKNKSLIKVTSLQNRIQRFRSTIHLIPKLDNETKVKLMFALSAPVDYGFLRELRKQAEVTVDDSNRIVHYKKKRGNFELKGKHTVSRKVSEDANAEILEFLAEKVQKENGVISLTTLTKEFLEETGNHRGTRHMQERFRKARDHIYESDRFDENTKIRMMFATSTVIPDYVLKELRKKAIVVLDKENCIEEYKKKDGSLNLKKEKTPSEKRKSLMTDDTVDYSDNVEENEEDDREGETMNAMTRSGRLSKMKIYSDDSVTMNQDDSDFDTPMTRNKKRKIAENMKKTVGEIISEETSEDALGDDFSFDDVSYQSNDNNGVNLDRHLRGAPENVIDIREADILAPEDNIVEEIQAPIESLIIPKHEEMLLEVKMEDVITIRDDYVAPNSSKNQQKNDSIDQDRTPLPMVLESLYDFIDILEIPILSDLQKQIKTKLEEYKKNSKIRMVSNKIIFHSMELCLLKVNENWEKEDLDGIESLRLKTFLTPFKVIVKYLNVSSLVEFQKKLEKLIEVFRLEEKTVPLTTIRGALQNTIDNLITF